MQPASKSFKSEAATKPRNPNVLFPMQLIPHTLHDAGVKMIQRGSYWEVVEGFSPKFFTNGEPNKLAQDCRKWFAKRWTITERNAAPITECEACNRMIINAADRCTCYGINRPHFHRSCHICGAKWEECTPDYGSFEWCYEWIETAIDLRQVTFMAIPKMEEFRAEKLAQIDAAWESAAKSLTIGAEEADKQLGLFGYVKTRTHRHAHSAKRLEVSHVIQQARPRMLSTQGEGTMFLWAF
jgi:hypothetical protein